MTISFNLVDGSSWVGFYDADGAWNAVSVDGTAWTGRMNTAGCLNIYIDPDDGVTSELFGVNHPCGALRVVEGESESGAIEGSGLS